MVQADVCGEEAEDSLPSRDIWGMQKAFQTRAIELVQAAPVGRGDVTQTP
jgi:hypothetical protein